MVEPSLTNAHSTNDAPPSGSIDLTNDAPPESTTLTNDPPESKPVDESMRLTIRGQDGTWEHYKIRRNMRIKRLLATYCRRRCHENGAIRFLLDGEFFNHDKTPEQLGLQDGDTIDAMVSQLGGQKIWSKSMVENQ